MREKILIQNISANLTGFLITFLVISDGFLGLIFKLILNKSKYFHVLFVTSQKHKWVLSNIILDLNIKGGGSE